MHSLLGLGVVVPVATLALTAADTSTESGPGRALFAETTCAGELAPPGRVTCGYLSVPERRDDPTSPLVEMAVAIVHPVGAADHEPLVYLAGGPGEGATGLVDSFLDEPLAAGRDVVLVDYRGVGSSRPSLACPELDALELPHLGLRPDDPVVAEETSTARLACRERLVAAGVDLAAYDYPAIAADLADLRVALGYDEWNLYGLSNGGRVALEVVRRHPEGVRSLVLDAALPPQGSLPGELWPHAQRAFEELFAACAADAACSAAYPDLATTFANLVERLEAEPMTVTVDGPAGPVDVTFTGTTMLNSLRGALYEAPLIPLLPQFISLLATGEGFDAVASLIVERSGPGDFSAGMFLSVECREEVAFLPADLYARQAAELPLMAPALRVHDDFEACAEWNVGTGDPSIDDPVVSAIPALVLVGQFDPVHPLASSEAIAAGLSRSTLLEFPGLGHGVVFDHPCPHSLVGPFLDEPAADVSTACVDDMGPPRWVLP